MIRLNIKQMIKNPLNLLWVILLPLAWFIGTKYIRENVDLFLSFIADNNISYEASKAIQEQLDVVNGFMFFVEGASAFYLPFVIVLLVGIIYSSAFIYDKNTGFGNFTITRTDYRKYFLSKIISIFAISFLSIFIILTGVFAYSLVKYSSQLPTENFNFSMILDSPTTKLFMSKPVLSCFIIVFTLSLFGAIYSLIGMGVSLFTSNRFLISISPLAIYLLSILLPQLFSIQSPISRYIAWVYPNYLTGFFIENQFWYTNFSHFITYIIHFMVIIIPAVVMNILLYTSNKRHYIK